MSKKKRLYTFLIKFTPNSMSCLSGKTLCNTMRRNFLIIPSPPPISQCCFYHIQIEQFIFFRPNTKINQQKFSLIQFCSNQSLNPSIEQTDNKLLISMHSGLVLIRIKVLLQSSSNSS